MRIKEVSIGKEMKIGLPNYSNITARCDIKFEIGEAEVPDWSSMWDEVNRQLALQTGDTDPSWIGTKEYRNFFKVTIKQSKGGDSQ